MGVAHSRNLCIFAGEAQKTPPNLILTFEVYIKRSASTADVILPFPFGTHRAPEAAFPAIIVPTFPALPHVAFRFVT